MLVVLMAPLSSVALRHAISASTPEAARAPHIESAQKGISAWTCITVHRLVSMTSRCRLWPLLLHLLTVSLRRLKEFERLFGVKIGLMLTDRV